MQQACEVSLERILQANETAEVALRSTAHLTPCELDEVESLMGQMKDAYPAQEIPLETVLMWAPAWAALAAKYSIAALRAALSDHILASKFFPNPSEIRERIEARLPPPFTGYVPLTPRQILRLTGRVEQPDTFECVQTCYGTESARRYTAKIQRGE
jgi:hypothetical protein